MWLLFNQKFVAGLGIRLGALFLVLAFALGLASGYLLGGYSPSDPSNTPAEASTSSEEVVEVSTSSGYQDDSNEDIRHCHQERSYLGEIGQLYSCLSADQSDIGAIIIR